MDRTTRYLWWGLLHKAMTYHLRLFTLTKIRLRHYRTIILLLLVLVVGSPPAEANSTDALLVENQETGASFLALGWGLGRFHAHRTGSDDSVSVMALQLGQCLTSDFCLTEEYLALPAEALSSNPVTEHNYNMFLVGARWILSASPKKKNRVAWLIPSRDIGWSTYLNATVGLTVLDKTAYDAASVRESVLFAPTGMFAFGLLPYQGRDHALGIELRGQTTRYNDGWQYGVAVLLVAQARR